MLTRRTQIGAILAALGAATVAVTVSAAAPGAAQTAPLGGASPVAMLTGAQSINATEARYRVKGTDLGIMWTDERGQILAAFGDTFGPGWGGISSGFANPGTIDWRSNTLARSTDRTPSNGMSVNDYVTDRPGHAKELLPSLKKDGGERSKIPTGGGNVGDAPVARGRAQQLLDQSAYEYWTEKGWQRGSSEIATPIVDGPVGELSVRYDQTLKSWEMMYLDESRKEIVVRLAPQPTGP